MYLYASPSGVDDSISIVMPGFTYGEMMRKFYPNIHGEDTGIQNWSQMQGGTISHYFLCAFSFRIEIQSAEKQIDTDKRRYIF